MTGKSEEMRDVLVMLTELPQLLEEMLLPLRRVHDQLGQVRRRLVTPLIPFPE